MNSQQNNIIEVIDITITRRHVNNVAKPKAENVTKRSLAASHSKGERVEITKRVSGNIRTLRLAHNMPLRVLAEKTSISLTTLHQYENGTYLSGVKSNLNKIAKALGVILKDLQNCSFDKEGRKVMSW